MMDGWSFINLLKKWLPKGLFVIPLAGRPCCWTGQFAVRGVDLIND